MLSFGSLKVFVNCGFLVLRGDKVINPWIVSCVLPMDSQTICDEGAHRNFRFSLVWYLHFAWIKTCRVAVRDLAIVILKKTPLECDCNTQDCNTQDPVDTYSGQELLLVFLIWLSNIVIKWNPKCISTEVHWIFTQPHVYLCGRAGDDYPKIYLQWGHIRIQGTVWLGKIAAREIECVL